MTQFKELITDIKNNKNRKKNGLFNAIPFPFKRFNSLLGGILRGKYYCVTSGTGVGKTQISKFLFVNTPFDFWLKNQDKFKLKIFYFALEESKREFMLSFISNYVKTKYGDNIDNLSIDSITEELSDDLLNKIESAEKHFEKLESVVDVVDTVTNPSDIYEYLKSYALKNGKFEYYDKEINGETKQFISKYVPNEEEWVIVVIDHISLIEEYKGKDLAESMGYFSFRVLRLFLTKILGYTVVSVQQQMAAQESTENFKLKKLEPSLQGLADNKRTSRDYQIVLGLFAPDRYKLEEHNNYDITQLKDNYRSLSVLKNRFGRSNVTVGLYFNGESNIFKELPKAEDMKTTDYEKCINKTY